MCTLYAIILVLEHKIKIRKGKNLGWLQATVEIKELLTLNQIEKINKLEDNNKFSQGVSGVLIRVLREAGTCGARQFFRAKVW